MMNYTCILYKYGKENIQTNRSVHLIVYRFEENVFEVVMIKDFVDIV